MRPGFFRRLLSHSFLLHFWQFIERYGKCNHRKAEWMASLVYNQCSPTLIIINIRLKKLRTGFKEMSAIEKHYASSLLKSTNNLQFANDKNIQSAFQTESLLPTLVTNLKDSNTLISDKHSELQNYYHDIIVKNLKKLKTLLQKSIAHLTDVESANKKNYAKDLESFTNHLKTLQLPLKITE